MFRIKLFMVIGGIVLAWIGIQEWRLAQESKEIPQTISCADLSAQGPGENAHIVMTDSLVCSDSFVYEGKKNNPAWKKIWVPVVPRNGEYVEQLKKLIDDNGGKVPNQLPPPQNIKVILTSSKVSNQAELEALASQPAVTGLVINKIDSLGLKQRKILEESYPGTDFTRCWIIDHDRKPAGIGKVVGMAGGGALLAIVGVGMMVVGRSSPKA